MPLSRDNAHHIEQFAKTEFAFLDDGTSGTKNEQLAAMTLIERLAANGWSMVGIALPDDLGAGETIVKALMDLKGAIRIATLNDADVDEARYIFCAGLYKAAIEAGVSGVGTAKREAVKALLDARLASLPVEVAQDDLAAAHQVMDGNMRVAREGVNTAFTLLVEASVGLLVLRGGLAVAATLAPEAIAEYISAAADFVSEGSSVVFGLADDLWFWGPLVVPLIALVATCLQEPPPPRQRVAEVVPDVPAPARATGGTTVAMVAQQGGAGVEAADVENQLVSTEEAAAGASTQNQLTHRGSRASGGDSAPAPGGPASAARFSA